MAAPERRHGPKSDQQAAVLTAILGISCHYHDAAAALLVDGQLVAAAEEERFTRNKHDSRFPTSAIEFALRQANITADELDYVVFYEKPLKKFFRILNSSIEHFPKSRKFFISQMSRWLSEKLWTKSNIIKKIIKELPNHDVVKTPRDAAISLLPWLSPGDTILIKGSRKLELEKVLPYLQQ